MARKHWRVNLKLTVHGETKQEAVAFATECLQVLVNQFDEHAGLAGTENPQTASPARNHDCAICAAEEGADTPAAPVTSLDTFAELKSLSSIKETALFFRVNERTVREWIRAGRLPVFKTAVGGSGRVLVTKVAIIQLFNSMAQPEVPGGA